MSFAPFLSPLKAGAPWRGFGRVEQVIAWPIPRPGGGGTGHAIRVASALGIPVIDLSTEQERQRVLVKLDTPEQ